MALNRSDKSRILRRYFPGMTRNSEMSTEPRLLGGKGGKTAKTALLVPTLARYGGRSTAFPAP